MDPYVLSIAIIGAVGLTITWLVSLTKKIGISYSLIFLVFGLIAFAVFDDLPWASPFRNQSYTVHFTELLVIIAIMNTGLRIDRPFSIRGWRTPFLLVTVTMVISIAAVAALGFWGIGLGVASAVLLGAVLAPTDPVLAADVQVGPPHEGDGDEVRFSLTAEAGMNDGLAFPFTWLAIALATAAGTGEPWLAHWLWKDVLVRLVVGLVLGFVIGRLTAYLFIRLPKKLDLREVRQGLVAISTTLVVYGVTELAHGYGFIAVFVAAVTIRNYEMDHEYHETLHSFVEQVEHILMATLLILLGGAVIDGILEPLTWRMALVGVVVVFVVRPVAGMAAAILSPATAKQRLAISFLGIKGVGSFFYLAFALKKADFEAEAQLWAIAAFIVLLSLLVHGLTASAILKRVVPRTGT